jgi:hypothetical protein
MISPNQFYDDNLQREYPLRPGTSVADAVFADAVFRITSASEALGSASNTVQLVSLTAGTGTSVRFDVVGGPLAGASFRGVIPGTPSVYERVRLDFYDALGALSPSQGYGWLICGTATIPTGTYADPVEPAAIRYLESALTASFRLANAPCGADTIISESQGPVGGISFQNRTATTVARCVEIATVPPAPIEQSHISPDPAGSTVVQVPIPAPVESVTSYETGATSVLTTHGIVVADSLPSGPGYDASPVGSAVLGATVEAGHNIRLTGSVRDGVLRINYALGAGRGPYCGPMCSPGVPGISALKSINGVQGESLEFVRGTAIDVLASPGDHILYFIVHPEKLNRATA